MGTMDKKVFLLPASTVQCHHLLSLKVLSQKRKPQTDGVILRVLHILGHGKYFYGDLGYFKLLFREVYMHSVKKQFTT